MSLWTTLGAIAAVMIGAVACGAAEDESGEDEGAVEAEDTAPAPRPLVRVVWRDAVTDAWLAKEPSSTDGAPIGTASPRSRELYSRLTTRLSTAKRPPAVVLMNIPWTADQAPTATDADMIKAIGSAPFPVVLPVLPDKAPEPRFYASTRVATGHDRAFFQCLLTETVDASLYCRKGAKVVPLGPLADPMDEATRTRTPPPVPFPAQVVATAAFLQVARGTFDPARPMGLGPVEATASALAPLVEELDAITSSGRQGSRRTGIVSKEVASLPAPLAMSAVISDDAVLDSLAGTVVVIGGQAASAQDQWFGLDTAKVSSTISMAADVQRMLDTVARK